MKEDIKPGGYHTQTIHRGKLGELSKVQEELSEAIDAWSQNNKIMTLIELSDMIGAIRNFLKCQYGEHIGINDLEIMANATERAFKNGDRS